MCYNSLIKFFLNRTSHDSVISCVDIPFEFTSIQMSEDFIYIINGKKSFKNIVYKDYLLHFFEKYLIITSRTRNKNTLCVLDTETNISYGSLSLIHLILKIITLFVCNNIDVFTQYLYSSTYTLVNTIGYNHWGHFLLNSLPAIDVLKDVTQSILIVDTAYFFNVEILKNHYTVYYINSRQPQSLYEYYLDVFKTNKTHISLWCEPNASSNIYKVVRLKHLKHKPLKQKSLIFNVLFNLKIDYRSPLNQIELITYIIQQLYLKHKHIEVYLGGVFSLYKTDTELQRANNNIFKAVNKHAKAIIKALPHIRIHNILDCTIDKYIKIANKIDCYFTPPGTLQHVVHLFGCKTGLVYGLNQKWLKLHTQVFHFKYIPLDCIVFTDQKNFNNEQHDLDKIYTHRLTHHSISENQNFIVNIDISSVFIKNFLDETLKLHFSDRSFKYVIYTHPNWGWSEKAVDGIKNLHYLCDNLNRIGIDAYITCKKAHTELRTPYIDTTTLTDRNRYIVVYPDIIKTNPLKMKNIVRLNSSKYVLKKEQFYPLGVFFKTHDNVSETHIPCAGLLQTYCYIDLYNSIKLKKCSEKIIINDINTVINFNNFCQKYFKAIPFLN